MTFSRKLIDKLIKFTQSVYKIHIDPPEILLPQEILNLIPNIDKSKILARKQNLNSIVNNAQLNFECRFTLISTLLGFIGSHQISPSQMPYVSLIILQSCCGIFFWELQNAGSHYSLVFIRAFCQSVPFLQNYINEMKNFFSLFVERIYNDGEIDLTIRYLPAINEVMSKYPQLSENCFQLLLKIAKKLCKKLKTEDMPINQTNISYFFSNLSNVINIFPHLNYDYSKIIKRLLEISKIPTPIYLLDSYLSLLLSFHYHNADIIPLLEQISNGLINADSSSTHHDTEIKCDQFAELKSLLLQNNQDLSSIYLEYFTSKNQPISVIPNLNVLPESISGPAVNAATLIADHFNNNCKAKDYYEFLLILLNCQNFNVQAILLICILISGPPLRSQISELFARKNLWKLLLSERTFNPSISIFDDKFSRLINLRQSIFDVLAFMCTTSEVILSIRKAFYHFLSKFVQNPKFASEIILLSYPSLQPIYFIHMPNNYEDEMITLLLEIITIQQICFLKDPKNVFSYRFPTLTTILTILDLENCLNLVSNSQYSCRTLLSLLFERPLIPRIKNLIMKLAENASEKIKQNNNIDSLPFSDAFHKLFRVIIGRTEESDLLLKILKMIESEPYLIFLKTNLINDLFSAAISCSNESLDNREEILEYFLKILLKFKNFKEFDPIIVPFLKIANVCSIVGTFITIENDGSIIKNKLFNILYDICISDDVITLPEALPMLLLSLKDKDSQKYVMKKLIELCTNSEINRYSCLIGNVPSIIFNHKYDHNLELFKLISLTISNPKSLRSFLQCFESDELFEEALKYLSIIIDSANLTPLKTAVQLSSKGSHVTFPRISSTILDNGFIVHSTLFIESDEPKRNFFILKGGKNTFSLKFFHHSLMFQVESGESSFKYSIDADYPLKKWFDLSIMLKASEGITVGFDGNIMAGLSIESIELGNNIDYSFVFFTHFSENPKPIQMHSISLYANFLANELSISDFITYQNIHRKHLYYSFSADNVLNRSFIDDICISHFSGTLFRYECNFLRAFEATQTISFLLSLFRKVEYKPKLLDPLLSVIFNIIQKSIVVSNQMVKINGMAIISYFLEKLPSNELSKEKWKYFVDQIDKIKLKQLLRHFVKFIFYNFNIWSHASLDVQMQVICDWQQIGIFFEEFLTVPFLLQTFNNFYTMSGKYKLTQNLEKKKTNKLHYASSHLVMKNDESELPLSATSSMSMIPNLYQESDSDSNLISLVSSASSSIADLSFYMNSSSTNLADFLSPSGSKIISNSEAENAIKNYINKSNDESNKNNFELNKNNDELNKNNDELNKNNDELNKNNDESNKNNFESNKNNDESNKNNFESNKNNDESNKNNFESNKNNDESNKNNDESNKNNDELNKSNEELNKNSDVSNNSNDELNKSNDELSKSNDELNKNSDVSNNSNDELNKSNDELSKRYDELNKSNFELSKSNDELNKNNNELNNSNNELSKSSDELNTSNDELIRDNSDLSKISDDSRNDTDSDDSRSLRRSLMFNDSTGSFILDQPTRTPTRKRRTPCHKRSSSIESIAKLNFSQSFRSNSISSISYQKLIQDKLNSIRKIIISLINSVISLNKLNKREALFLFQAIQKAKEPEESFNLLEVVSFVIDSKLYMSSFDIKGQWIMLFLQRSEPFRIRWLNLFSKMYPNPNSSLSQSILFLLIIQTQVALTNSLLSTESLLVECLRICLNIKNVLNLKEIKNIPINFSEVKIQYFHFAIAISIAAQGELNDDFASALIELTSSDDFANKVASSSTTLTLFILIYWALRRSQDEKDDIQIYSFSLDSINEKNKDKTKKQTNYNQFSFPLKVDSVDKKAVTILARICSFSPSLTRTAIGIIDSISTITKASLSELRSEFLNCLFPIASTAEFIQVITEAIFFHYKIYNFQSLSLFYETYHSINNSRKKFDAQVPDLITLMNVYIGDIDRSPRSYFSLETDKNGNWIDESLAKSLIYVSSASKNEKLRPILAILIYIFCRRQKQSEIASLIPLTRELINEKDNYSYLIIYAVYRDRINSYLDLNSNSSGSFRDNLNDSSLKKRRKTEMNPTKSDDDIKPRKRRYSDLYNNFFKYNHEDEKINSNQEIEQKEHKVKINIDSLPRKNSNPVESKITNVSEVPRFYSSTISYPFDDELPDFVKNLLKSDPKFLKICYITFTQFCENSSTALTEVHKKLIDTFSSIQSIFIGSTYHKCTIHKTEKYLGKRAWEVLCHQMFTTNQSHFKRSSFTDYLSRPIILRRNFGFDRKYSEIKNAKKIDSFIENCIDSNEPLFETRCERIKVDKTINGTFYVLFTGIHRFNKEGINDKNNNLIDKKILRFISDRGKLIEIHVDQIIRILPMFVLQKKTAVEILTAQQRSFLFNFKTCHNVKELMTLMPPNLQFPTGKFLNNLTDSWLKRNISNYEYLTWLNLLSGRTFNSAYSYPVFPWILSDYESSSINLDDPKVYRDLSKPIGALNSTRLQKLKNLRDDNIEEGNNFLYRSTYSCAFHVFHYLVRLEPFTSLHIIMQDGKFDVAHRLFSSILNSYERVTSTFFNFRELIPEFFFNSDFLTNFDKFTFGGGIDNVCLPPWSKSPIDFVYKNRRALESEIVSSRINEWIDLIWGFKQTGQAAEEADNVFDPHLYPNVWRRYKFGESLRSDSKDDLFGTKAMKSAGILTRPKHRSSIGLPQDSAVNSLLNEADSEQSSSSSSSLLVMPSQSQISASSSQSAADSLYKNPAVESALCSTSKQQIEQLLSHVGQIPQQLFDSPHPIRQPASSFMTTLLNSSSSSSSQQQQQQEISSTSSSQFLKQTIQRSSSLERQRQLTYSILDLTFLNLMKNENDNDKVTKKKSFVNRKFEKTGKIQIDFLAISAPSGENNPIFCSNDRHQTIRRDGRIFGSLGPLTKDRIFNLENFITIGNKGFAAICTSTNEIVQINSSSLNSSSSENGGGNVFLSSSPSLPSPSSSASLLSDNDQHFTIIRRKSIFHVSKVTSICNVGNSIFTGDTDGIIANESTEFLLTAHRRPIVCMAGCEALRIVVSVSSDNLVVISAADDLCFIRSFKIEKTVGRVKKVVICKGFGIINFLTIENGFDVYRCNSKILAYSVNGDFIGSTTMDLRINNLIALTCPSNDLDLLVFSDNQKKIYLINAFELDEITELKEVESQVTSLNVFTQFNQQQQLVIGTELGILYFCNLNV